MAFTRISNSQINSRGATTLPNQPQISAMALKEEFDAPAKQIVAPAVNNLMDELEASTSAGNIGAVAPAGRTGTTTQGVINSVSADLATLETNAGQAIADAHTHANKTVLDKFGEDGSGNPTYDGSSIGEVKDAYKTVKVGSATLSANGEDTLEIEAGANIILTPDSTTNPKKITIASSGGGTGSATWGLIGGTLTNQTDLKNALDSKADTSSLATVATSGSYNDLSNKPTIPNVTNTYSGTSTDAMSGVAVKSAIDSLDGTITGTPSTSKTLSAFSQTDGQISATFSDISITKSQISDLGTVPSDIDDLSDVIVSTPSNGQVLTYDNGTWKNANASGGTPDAYKNIVSAGTTFAASGADTFKINAGSNVTITALSSPDKGIQISATGGGQSTGDMLMSQYDQSGDVKAASSTGNGIKDYVASAISGKQDTISGGDGITVSSNTVSVDFGTVASATTTKPPTGKAVYDAIAALDSTITGSAGAGNTLTALSQTDGKVSATFGAISITKSQVSDFPSLATVATSGSYSDLSNKPTIPTVTDTYSGTSSNGMSGKAVKSAIDALDVTTTGAATNKTITALTQTDGKISATFSNISITKSQISDFPTIPTVNNATLTIQKNGTNVQTFTANQSTNATANIITDDWVKTASVSSGSVTFSGIDDTGNYGYEVFFNITSSSTNKNPSAQLSAISGEGTSNMSLTYTTDADNGTNNAKLRRIK